MVFFSWGDLIESISPVINEGLVSMCEMVIEPLKRFLKCQSSNFVLGNPMLCFKLPNEIVLDVGSDIFIEDVGVNTRMLDEVSMNLFALVCLKISCRETDGLYQMIHIIYL